MPGLPTLHPGQGRLCSYGPLHPKLMKPTNEDLETFLNYLESTLDDGIPPRVQVYELEDIKKRSDISGHMNSKTGYANSPALCTDRQW